MSDTKRSRARGTPMANEPAGLESFKRVFSAEFWTPEMIEFVRTEILLGVIICFAQIPESVAFAFLANVEPPVALHAAWVVGLICSVFGGRPGMVNGATGAFAAIVQGFVKDVDEDSDEESGVEYLFPSVIFAGGLMALCWQFKLYRFITMIPATVMIGFVNGLAIVIGRAQLHPFEDEDTHEWIKGEELGWMICIMLLSMFAMELIPRLPYKAFKLVPSSLISILLAIFVEFVIVRAAAGHKGTKTINDVSPFTSDSAFPIPFFADDQYDLNKINTNWSGFQKIIVQGFLLCAVGVIESLMTQEVVNELTASVGDPSKTIAAMSVANMISGFLGGMGGNAMIGLSTINGLGGGKGRLAPIVTALGIMACVMGAYPVLNYIPVAALAGIMMVVVFHTFKWSSLLMILSAVLPAKARTYLNLERKVSRLDVLVIVVVTVVTVVTNLAYAVLAGLVLSALSFAYASGQQTKVEKSSHEGKDVYVVHGPLFFGSRMNFEKMFDYAGDAKVVQAHLVNAHVFDYSGLEALNNVARRYSEHNKKFTVHEMNASSVKLYTKARQIVHHVEVDVVLTEVPEVPTSFGPDVGDANRLNQRRSVTSDTKTAEQGNQDNDLASTAL